MPAAISKNSLDVISPPARAAFPGPSARGDSYASVASKVEVQSRGGNSLPPGGKPADEAATAAAPAQGKSATTAPVASDNSAVTTAEGEEQAQASEETAGLVVEAMTDDASQNRLDAENVLRVGAELTAARRAEGDLQADDDVDGDEAALLVSALATDDQAELPGGSEFAAAAADKAAADEADSMALDSAAGEDATETADEITLVESVDAALADADPQVADGSDTGNHEPESGAGTANVSANSRDTGSNRASGAGVDSGQQPAGSERVLASLRGNGAEAQAEQLSAGPAVGSQGQSSSADASPLTPFQQVSNLVALKAAVAAPPALVLPNAVGDPGWSEGLSGRITMMVNQKVGVATIHLNPADLGPIEVKVNLNHDKASVQFTSHAAQVRDALEQTIPRLREMLGDAGFTLIDSQVSDQSSGRDQPSRQRQGDGGSLAEIEQVRVEPTTVGMIDYYA